MEFSEARGELIRSVRGGRGGLAVAAIVALVFILGLRLSGRMTTRSAPAGVPPVARGVSPAPPPSPKGAQGGDGQGKRLIGNRLVGQVLDAGSGTPLPGARVVAFLQAAASGADDRDGTSFTRIDPHLDATGGFQTDFPPGYVPASVWMLVVQAPGYQEWKLPWANGRDDRDVFSVESSGALRAVVRMKRGRTLAGTVTDATGKPVAGARLELTLSGPDWCSWPHTFGVGKYHWPPEAVTDANGRWEILGFPVEQASVRSGARWVLTVEHDEFAPAIHQSIERLPASEGIVTISTVLNTGQKLSGEVADTEGKPIPGATVESTARQLPGDPLCIVFKKTAKTDAAGRFTFVGLGRSVYDLKAWSAEYAPGNLASVAPEGALSRLPRLVLSRGSELSGRVLHSDGSPVADLEVRLRIDKARYSDRSSTGADGSFRFTGLPSGQAALSSSFRFERRLPIPSKPVEIRLPMKRELIVLLTRKEDGVPLGPPGVVYYRGTGVSAGRPLSSADGRVSLGELYPAEYRLDVDAKGRMLVRAKVNLADGETGPKTVRLAVPEGFSLHGHVEDLSGRPLPGARVVAQGPDSYDKREAVCGADGSYEIRGLSDRQWRLVGWYFVYVLAEGYATESRSRIYFRFSPFERDLDFTLGPGGTVGGRVLTADGAPAAGRLVKALPPNWLGVRKGWSPYALPMAVTDGQGRYRLEHVLPGDVEIALEDLRRSVAIAHGGDVSLDWRVP